MKTANALHLRRLWPPVLACSWYTVQDGTVCTAENQTIYTANFDQSNRRTVIQQNTNANVVCVIIVKMCRYLMC